MARVALPNPYTISLVSNTPSLLFLYTLALTFIALYALAQLALMLAYARYWLSDKHKRVQCETDDGTKHVTIQIPLYNEPNVAARVIDAVAALEYPREKYEIQVLDDSDDDGITAAIVDDRVAYYLANGWHIAAIRRIERKGYKAGALAEGLRTATGDYVAVFDADFTPAPNFLRRTLPHFTNPRIGLVQTRWTHPDRHTNLLTALQALQLDVHFSIEQGGRYYGGYFMQFNGTAGVWRRACIDDAGGWQADTLTEDLDLSLRAQAAGWRMVYDERTAVAAELPADMPALRVQQFRWTKGGAECARKLLPLVWAAPLQRITLAQKLHATAQLLSSSVYAAILVVVVLSVPLSTLIKLHYAEGGFLTYFFASSVAFTLVYAAAAARPMLVADGVSRRVRLRSFVLHFPLFFALSTGMAAHNARAVFEGWMGRRSAFVRTPKRGNTHASAQSDTPAQRRVITLDDLKEAFLATYLLVGVALDITFGSWQMLPIHAIWAAGFGYVAVAVLRVTRY